MTLPWRIFTVAMIITGAAGMFYIFITAMSTGKAPLVAACVGLVFLLIGSIALYAHEKPKPDPPGRQPYVHVDWSMSDVCLHVSCPCPESANRIHHLDGYTFGRFRCPDCGNRFELPTKLEAHHLTETTKRKDPQP